MTIRARYTEQEVATACDRFCLATKGSKLEFHLWLGFSPEALWTWPLAIECGLGTTAHDKMEMLLGPHWYALLKASLAKELKHANFE